MDPTTPDDPVLPDDPDSEEKITVEEGSQGTTPDTPETPSDGDDIGPDDENSIPNNENSMLGEQPVTLSNVPELEIKATDEAGILAPSARDNSFLRMEHQSRSQLRFLQTPHQHLWIISLPLVILPTSVGKKITQLSMWV